MRLTSKFITSLKPPDKRREYPDAVLPGLVHIAHPSGRRSWAVRYKANGIRRKYTLSAKPIDLRGARAEARAVLERVDKGEDPQADKAAARQEAHRDLFPDVVDEFLKRHPMGERHKAGVENMLAQHVTSRWRRRRVQDIERRDIIALLDALTDSGLTVGANRVFSVVRKLFGWCLERGIVTANPCAGVRKPVAETSRDRVLTDYELKLFWRATSTLGSPFSGMFRLLLLTGARLREASNATWNEFNFEDATWTLPGSRAKNGKPHAWHLSAPALAVVEGQPRIAKSSYVFTTTGKTPSSGFSRAKRRLDKEMLRLAIEDDPNVEIPDWRLHDLRRTMASGMAKLGVGLPTIERILNHSSGSFSGVVGVYQRYDYAAERTAALDAWAAHVLAVAEVREAAKVVPIR